MPVRFLLALALFLLGLRAATLRAGEARARSGEDSSLYFENDRDAEKLLEAARQAARAGNWRQAVDAYQRLIDFAGKGGSQPLVSAGAAGGVALQRGEDAVWLTIQDAASRELARLPEAALRLYREGYDAPAKALLDAARTTRDAALLHAVAQRYLATSWGDDALALLGSLAFERGDFAGALAAWSRLVEAHPEPSVTLPAILARMWLCYRLLEHDGAAQSLAQELQARHGATSLRVAGRGVSVREFLAQDVAAASRGPLAHWPALGGDASHARAASGPDELGGLAWRFTRGTERHHSRDVAPPAHATVYADHVFLADHTAVHALNIATGQPVWLFPDAPEADHSARLAETLHAVACADGRAFARLDEAILAFDVQTGRLLWRRQFADDRQAPAPEDKPAEAKQKAADPEEADGEPSPKRKGRQRGAKALGAKTAILLTPPVVAGPRVFIGHTHLGEEARASLIALDAATGQELWRTFICSRTVPAFLGLGATAAPPAVGGGTVYCATNLGAIAALDSVTGAIHWVHRYNSFPSHLRQSILERGERWANNPPIVDGAFLVAAPQDSSSVLAIDLVRGTLAWSAPRGDARYLLGVDGGKVFAIGSQVVAMSRLTGSRLWEVTLPGPAAGRPALCRGRLYVPTDRALLTLHTADGRMAISRLWQPGEEPGNVTAAQHALFVASHDKLYGFNDWASTLAGLEARRKRDAGDPSIPLAIGLHAAQRGAQADALPHLEQALRLATERNDGNLVARARAALFEAHRALGEAGDATAFATAIEYAPSPRERAALWLALARLHEAQGRPAEAIVALQALLAQPEGAIAHLDGGLHVSARAAACAEISRIIRERGRDVYAAVEAEASRQLVAAKDQASLERLVRRFPNSAAAEEAMCRLLAAPGARTMAPHLRGMACVLALDPASNARIEVETNLKALSQGVLTPGARLATRWQVHTRVAHQRVQVLLLPGAPRGRLYLATARRSLERAAPYDGLECRQADTGQLLWQREVADWDAMAVLAGPRLAIGTFDRIIVFDPLSGIERWGASVVDAPAAGIEALEPEVPAPPTRRRPRAHPDDAPGGLGWPPWERRRSERHRIVALAADDAAVYAALAGGEVAAFAAQDGKRLWTRQLEAKVLLTRGIFVHGGKVWVCAESPGAVYVLNARDGTGNEAIAFERDEAAFRLPRITDRPAFVPALARLYVVLDDHTVHAIDLAKGSRLWDAYVESSINRILASEDGRNCFVVPDVFLHNAQVLSLDPATGKVRRRRSVLGAALTDAVLGDDALYVAERDTENALVIRALGLDDLGERWRTTPLLLAQPTGLALGDGLLGVAGRHGGSRIAVLIHAATGRIIGDHEPKGATELSTALAGDLLVLGTDRGILGLGGVEPQALDQQIVALSQRAAEGDRAALAPLATALAQRGDEKAAIKLLANALSDETLPLDDYASLKDKLNALGEALAAREPAVIETAAMRVPPRVDGEIDEPWRADLAARLDGPAHIGEVQGVPAAEARWRSPSDLSAVLYTGWDARHFYFALDVSDDVHRTYTGQTDTWIGDGLIISIDCDNDGGYGYRFTGRDLLLTLALTRKDERRDDEGEDEPSGEYRVRLKGDNSGAVYEVALPWDYLGIENPKPGLRFGFNVTVLDDDGDRAVKALSWSPGMILDRERTMLIRGFTPELFGKVLLTGPPPGPPPLYAPAQPSRDEGGRLYRIRPSSTEK